MTYRELCFKVNRPPTCKADKMEEVGFIKSLKAKMKGAKGRKKACLIAKWEVTTEDSERRYGTN